MSRGGLASERNPRSSEPGEIVAAGSPGVSNGPLFQEPDRVYHPIALTFIVLPEFPSTGIGSEDPRTGSDPVDLAPSIGPPLPRFARSPRATSGHGLVCETLLVP